METFVRAAVRFAHPSSGKPGRCAAAELLRDASRLAGHRSPRLRTEEGSQGPLHCWVDREQATECLAALLTNADEATGRPEDTRVGISRRVNDAGQNWLRFAVTDDGPGIPGELHERVFEPFYSTKAAHIGMGLAFAQKFAQHAGGRIEVCSTPGAGSTFTLCLLEAEPR